MLFANTLVVVGQYLQISWCCYRHPSAALEPDGHAAAVPGCMQGKAAVNRGKSIRILHQHVGWPDL